MFTYGLARAVNQGWINPTTYGSIALAGWIGVTERVNAQGQVEGTCVATTSVHQRNKTAAWLIREIVEAY